MSNKLSLFVRAQLCWLCYSAQQSWPPWLSVKIQLCWLCYSAQRSWPPGAANRAMQGEGTLRVLTSQPAVDTYNSLYLTLNVNSSSGLFTCSSAVAYNSCRRSPFEHLIGRGQQLPFLLPRFLHMLIRSSSSSKTANKSIAPRK